MPRKRTYFYDPAKLTSGGEHDSGEHRNTLLSRARGAMESQAPAPTTELQALMEAAPFAVPRASAVERDVDFGPLTEAIESLGDRERWIIEALFWRRLSLRDLAAELAMGKTQVARIRDMALVNLRDALVAASGGVRPMDLVAILGSIDNDDLESE